MLELVWPTASRRGLLPLSTTRGDRFFISLLVAAFVHVGFLGFSDGPVWIASIISILLAVVLICPVMMLVLHDVRAGVLSMIPNVTPVVIVFGAMGWCGLEVDVGSVLTASVALGIAVDDTLHFLKWYTRASQLGFSRHDAIREAFRRCALAMVQTTLICGFGLLVLVQSSFIPTCRFAVLVFLLLMLALPGDLILLPAILASPLGKYFERRRDLPPRKS